MSYQPMRAKIFIASVTLPLPPLITATRNFSAPARGSLSSHTQLMSGAFSKLPLGR